MKTQKEIEDKLNKLQEIFNSNFTYYRDDLIPIITTLKWILNK